MFRAVEVGIKVSREKYDIVGSLSKRKSGLAGLIPSFGFANEILDFASVAEVWAIASAAEDVDSDSLGVRGSVEILLLELEIQDLKKFGVGEVLEAESILDRKAS